MLRLRNTRRRQTVWRGPWRRVISRGLCRRAGSHILFIRARRGSRLSHSGDTFPTISGPPSANGESRPRRSRSGRDSVGAGHRRSDSGERSRRRLAARAVGTILARTLAFPAGRMIDDDSAHLVQVVAHGAGGLFRLAVAEMPDDAAVMLRAGLAQRLVGICAVPGPGDV